MYTREIQEPRLSPIENGVPLQGTWTKAFKNVDLLEIHRPYPFPLLKGARDIRIKEWESFVILDDNLCLQARLCNLKFYRTATVNVYNKESGEQLEFRKNLPGGGWKLPRSLNNSSVDSRSMGFLFRIHSWLDTGKIILELNIKPTPLRPSFTAHVTFDLTEGHTTPLAVSLLFSDYRNMYAYKALTAVSGDLVMGGQHIHLDHTKTSGLFCDHKGYYPYRMRSAWCSGLGYDSQKRRIGFSLGENQAREPYKNNENALWIDGALTPLPPVKITRDGGTNEKWIIQDMEGMVDLAFTPKITGKNATNFLFTKSDHENPMGCFNGKLVDANGEEIPVHNIWGTGEKLYLRV